MTPLYLLDTNVVSSVLKGIPPEIRARVDGQPTDTLAISAITAAELRYGVAKRPGQTRIGFHIEDFLLRVPTLSWDAGCAAVYGRLKNHLLRSGLPLSELDLQIASHALSLGAVLVSHDRAFHQVPGLSIEDWTP